MSCYILMYDHGYIDPHVNITKKTLNSPRKIPHVECVHTSSPWPAHSLPEFSKVARPANLDMNQVPIECPLWDHPWRYATWQSSHSPDEVLIYGAGMNGRVQSKRRQPTLPPLFMRDLMYCMHLWVQRKEVKLPLFGRNASLIKISVHKVIQAVTESCCIVTWNKHIMLVDPTKETIGSFCGVRLNNTQGEHVEQNPYRIKRNVRITSYNHF